MRLVSAVRTWLVPVATGVLLVAACGSSGRGPSSPPALIDRHGIRMEFPEGWHTRISYLEGTPGPVVEAATLPFPVWGPDSLWMATHSMGSEDVILAVHDETGACPCDGSVETATPPSIGAADFTTWDGLDETHSLATLSVVIDGRTLVVWVTFGSDPPSPARLDEVNRILASTTFTDTEGERSEAPIGTWRPPTFEPAPGWNVASTGPVPIDSEVLPETWAANVPFAAEDLHLSALSGQLIGWPEATLKRLPAYGVVMVSWVSEVPASPNAGYPARELPLRLADAEVYRDWEGQVAPNVPFHWIRATVEGRHVEVRVFFGTQEPSEAALRAAQDELDRLIVPDPTPPAPPVGATDRDARRIPPEGAVLFSSGARILDPEPETGTPHGGLFGYDISPDGAAVVATTEERLSTGISVQPKLVLIDTVTGEQSVVARSGPRESFNGPITWSPDGTRIAYAFVRYRTDPAIVHPGPHPELLTVCIIELATRTRTCYPDLGTVFEFDWSPDGSLLAVSGPGPQPLQLVDVATGQRSTFASLDDPGLRDAVGGRAVQFTSPAWSPSGDHLAVWVNAIPAGSVPIVFGRDGHVAAQGRAATWDPRELMWLPDRDLLLYTPGVSNERTAYLRLFELDPATGEERVVLRRKSPPQIIDVAVSPTGRWAALLRWNTYARLRLEFADLIGNQDADIPVRFETELADWGPSGR